MKKVLILFILLISAFCFSQVAVRVDGLAAGDYPAISGTTGTILTNNYTWRTAMFVSALYGNDDTGTRNNPRLPYKFIQTATDAAIPGDTVVVLDGTFDEELTNRQNVAYYFNPGTYITNSYGQNFYTADSITNITIKGYGVFKSSIEFTCAVYSTNICSLVLEADYCQILGGVFQSANVQINTMVGGFYDAINPSYYDVIDQAPAYQVFPLSESAVSWNISDIITEESHARTIEYHNVNYTNSNAFTVTGPKRLYGGILNTGNNPYSVFELYGTIAYSSSSNLTGTFIQK